MLALVFGALNRAGHLAHHTLGWVVRVVKGFFVAAGLPDRLLLILDESLDGERLTALADAGEVEERLVFDLGIDPLASAAVSRVGQRLRLKV